MTEQELRKLVQIACQRLGGWTWKRIAVYHGWKAGKTAHKWSEKRLALWFSDGG